MIKIIRVISRLNIGGPAIHTILLNGELNSSGYKDILVAGCVSESEGDMIYLAREKGVRPIIIPELGREISPVNDIKAFFKLYRIMRREHPDIVHTHTAKAGTLGRLAAICAGVHIKVHTFHGHVFDGYFNPVKAKIFVLIERFLAIFTDRVIMVSQLVKDDIVDRLKVSSESKSVVVSLGLELQRFLHSERLKGILRKKFSIPDGVALIGIVGRLVPIKNHRMFLDVVSAIKASAPEKAIKFLIVGDGELRKELERYVSEKGLADRVIFTGWIEDVASVYADLDVVALTSLNEGTPVSLIEAMASSRAVVATDVGGVGDLLRDGTNGMLVKSGDVSAMANVILALLSDSSRRARLGESGKAYVAERFSKERLVKDIIELYSSLLDGARK